jgi:hypothetical protein
MSDPLTTFDVLAVTGIVVALAGAVTILWKAFKSQVDEIRKTLAAANAEHKAELADLVKRVRSLEEKRLDEAKEYAVKLEAMSRQQMTVFGRAVSAIQDITRIVSGWMQASNGRPLQPTPLPEVDTEVLLRQDEKVRKSRQEESSRP